MSAMPFSFPIFKAFTTTGTLGPLAGGLLHTFEAGTSTPLAVYQDDALTTPHTNPVVLDSNGQATIYLGPNAYKMRLEDSTGAVQPGWPIDGIEDPLDNAKDYTDTLRADLAASSGSSLVGFLLTSGADARTLEQRGKDTVYLTDWNVKGDGVTDDTAEIQKACDFCSVMRKSLIVPTPSVGYLISSPIDVIQMSMIGEIPYDPVIGVGQFICKTNINAFHIRGYRMRIENLGLRYDLGALATSAAVGFLFGDSTTQFSRSQVRNCFVRYAYDAFKANTAGTGTLWMNRFENCSSDFHVNYGFDLSCVNGSTTLMMDGCYCVGDDSGGNTPKGIRIQNVVGISCGLLPIDKATDSALYLGSCTGSINHIQLESCVLKTASAAWIVEAASSINIKYIRLISNTVDVGAGNVCGIVNPSASPSVNKVGQIFAQSTTTVSGTLYKYRIGSIATNGLIIDDGGCTYNDIYDNGHLCAVLLNGHHYAAGAASLLGAWLKGDQVRWKAPVEAGVAPNKYVITGWVRITDGSGNVLNTDWLQMRSLTGN